MDIPYSLEEIIKGMLETVGHNGAWPCYIRPVVFRGYGDAGVNPLNCPVEMYIVNYPWGKYLGEEALAEGVDVCVSSWTRLAPNTLPAMAKAGANYMNSQLIKMEAIANGYVEGIALDSNGYVSEGSGENIFVVRDGKIHTPPLGASVLPGITRDTVLTSARDECPIVGADDAAGDAVYRRMKRSSSGTAAEITRIRSVDRITVGKGGGLGPVTRGAAEGFLRHRARREERPTARLAHGGADQQQGGQ